jgi:TolB-like protein/DNA-binding winged helix-turn-helix (wHTH) protein/Flp pilus assembly protein TadD
MPASGSHVIRFGVFELDGRSGELRRHGLRVRLPDQSFQILKLLLSRPGEVVSRDDLRCALWTSETFVDFEVGLNSAVRKLREALDDSADNPRFVETLPRRGYRFIASVSTEPESVLITEPAAAHTPERESFASSRSSGRRWSLTVLLLVLLAGSASALYRRGGREGARAADGGEPVRVLAVLPFENLTGDAAQEYVVDSVSDALMAHLAQAADLDVVSRTSARHYKQTAKRLPEIGRDLNADGVVEGSVGRAGETVRVTVQLIRAATDRNVWSQTYEGPFSQMLRLQKRIASDLAVAAGQPMLQNTRRSKPHDVNPQAYDAYLKGMKAQGLMRHEGFQRAVAYFEKAVAIQPDFAEAYAQLALSHLQFAFGGPFSAHEAMPRAEAAARKALELDDTISEAHRVLGQVLSLYHWKWDEGTRAIEHGAKLRRDGDAASPSTMAPLIRAGRFAEAITMAERGRRLDPLSLNAQVNVGTAHHAAGNHDRALDEFRQALALSPGNNRVRFLLGVTYVAMDRLDDAIRELEPAVKAAHGHNSRFEAYLGYAYAAAGRTEEARAVLKELEFHRRDQYVSSFGIALIHDALGEKEPALAALEGACKDRAVEFSQPAQYPRFKTIAGEPRYQAVMRQVGLPR